MLISRGEEGTMFLAKFLYRNMKGLRFLAVLAILVAIMQVSCDILALQALKWIPSKAQNPGNDPACNISFLGVNDNPGLLDHFDIPALDPSLNPPPGGTQPVPPPTSPCPANPSDPRTLVNPDTTHHIVVGVIVFSLIVLVVFSVVSAFLVYLDLYLAAYIAQHLSAKLRKQLFQHLQRISLDWPGRLAGQHFDAWWCRCHHAVLQCLIYCSLPRHHPCPRRDSPVLHTKHQSSDQRASEGDWEGGGCRHRGHQCPHCDQGVHARGT